MSEFLLVPIKLHGLVIGNSIDERTVGDHGKRTLRRWRHQFRNLESLVSPEPEPFGYDDPVLDRGVHLLWTLPAGLRRRRHNGTFPLIPNRWLVTRYDENADKSPYRHWVIASDAISEGDGYLDPHAKEGAKPCKLGASEDFMRWSEPAAAGKKDFLTAFGPTGAIGMAYHPQLDNVLALSDTDVAMQRRGPLHYSVIGWYANPASDILCSSDVPSERKNYGEFLKWLGWSWSNPANEDLPKRSVFHGAFVIKDDNVFGYRSIPLAIPITTQIRTAVGMSVPDAARALLAPAPSAKGHALASTALAAALHGRDHLLDEPDGLFDLVETMHAGTFGSRFGGRRWEIHDTDDGTGKSRAKPAPVVPTAAETAALAALNALQEEIDLGWRIAHTAQRDFYELWWKRQFHRRHGGPGGPNGKDMDRIGRLTKGPDDAMSAYVPLSDKAWEEAQSALDRSIGATEKLMAPLAAAIGTARQAVETANKSRNRAYALHAVENARFHHPLDPVILLEGLGGDHAEADPVCRTELDLNKGRLCSFGYKSFSRGGGGGGRGRGGRQSSQGGVRINYENLIVSVNDDELFLGKSGATHQFYLPPDLSGKPSLPSCAAKLIREAVLFGLAPLRPNPPDPVTEMKFVENTTGPMIGTPTPVWRQPWLPLYLEWDAVWRPLPARNGENWDFEGMDYVDTKAPPVPPKELTVGGRAVLIDSVAAFMGRALPQAAAEDGRLFPLGNGRFMAATLHGFNEQIGLRDPLPNGEPGAEAKEFGPAALHHSHQKAGGQARFSVPKVGDALAGWPADGLRAGRFIFKRLHAVDRFGQRRDLMYSGLLPYRSDMVVPKYPREDGGSARSAEIQLPPRLFQAARLEVDFVPGRGDGCPVLGWLLPCIHDHSVVVFDSDGGGVSIMSPNQAAAVESETFPAATAAAPAGVFAELVTYLKEKEGFATLRSCFEAASEHILPDSIFDETFGTVLIGRPVALVRVRLRIAFGERAPAPAGWSPRGGAPPAATFPVHLGNGAHPGDGVLGVWDGTRFHNVLSGSTYKLAVPVVQPPPSASARALADYGKDGWVTVTLLMEARAAVHAYAGVLPVTEARLDHRWIEAALGRMEVPFRVGPVVCDAGLSADGTVDLEVRTPLPASQRGTWRWYEYRTAGGGEAQASWHEAPVAPALGGPPGPGRTLSLRDGILVLKRDQDGPAK